MEFEHQSTIRSLGPDQKEPEPQPEPAPAAQPAPQQQPQQQQQPQPAYQAPQPEETMPQSNESNQSLIARAIRDDPEALEMLFRPLLPKGESIVTAQYMGIEGIWMFGTKSFACVTNRRVAALKIAPFGEKHYQDGELDMLNSSAIHQPSKLPLYIGALALIGFIASFLVSFFLMEIWIGLIALVAAIPIGAIAWMILLRLYYRFFKCGLIFWVREGIPVYIFVNRGRLLKANQMYRLLAQYRQWNKDLSRNITLTRPEQSEAAP